MNPKNPLARQFAEYSGYLGAFPAMPETGLCGNYFRSFASGKTPHWIQAVYPSVEASVANSKSKTA
jgi:hypothetical protein